ncbi:hypothetical protein B0H19DRAFT_1111311 [Mycena capillaripes]|nr:hypothetical protein B0H19DRAFT_1111311 [Mycena capillaripes]
MDAGQDAPRVLHPALPKALEREIFEFSALSNPRSIPSLLHSGTEPLLYRALSVVPDNVSFEAVGALRILIEDCLKLLDSKSPSFLRDSVRHVALTGVSNANTMSILSGCSGIVRLSIFKNGPDPALLPLLAEMPLLRLSVDLDTFFGHQRIDFTNPLFNRLTHLGMFGTNIGGKMGVDLGALPCLTHLSTYFRIKGVESLFYGALASCKTLEALVLIFVDETDRKQVVDQLQFLADDPRSVVAVVTSFLGDWETGTICGEDYWIRADRFIPKRRTGEIKCR